MKGADPPVFEGNPKEVEAFLLACCLQFSLQPSKFAKEKKKVLFATTFLNSPPKAWIQPSANEFLTGNTTISEFTSFRTFTKSLSALYGDLNLERNAVVSEAGFTLVCKQDGTKLFFLTMKKAKPKGAVAYNNITVEDEIDLSTIPPEYHDFADLFSQKKVNELPAHGPYDHKIPLVEGTTPHWGPIYKLSSLELDALSKYIEEHLRKGFI